ncbi:MAG: type ISP restriction/modification enzyme [Nitrospinota bacterium]
MLKSYLKKIYKAACQRDATEQSYYSALEDLFKEYAQSVNKKNVHITTIPKKTEAGNPDFRVWDGKQHIIGYLEAKDLKIEYLDQIETSEQLKRYRHTFPNLILTNFFEFRLYRNEKLVEKLKYDEKQKRVFFNDIQYIEKVSKDVWEYQIGGYQVCSKWLKDRKGKKLSAKDIKHCCKIVTSLQKTIQVQEDIDEIYNGVEKNVIDFKIR